MREGVCARPRECPAKNKPYDFFGIFTAHTDSRSVYVGTCGCVSCGCVWELEEHGTSTTHGQCVFHSKITADSAFSAGRGADSVLSQQSLAESGADRGVEAGGTVAQN